jgi:hypothetical protein
VTDTAASSSAVPVSVPGQNDAPAGPPPHPAPVGRAGVSVSGVPGVAGRVRRSDGGQVRRVVRRIEPMSVLKLSVLFYACVFVVVLVAGVVLWLVASAAGVVGNVETFIGDLFALDEFHFEAFQILRAAFVGGAVLVLLGTALNVLAVTLFNLLADLVGGVELTVVEDERRPAPGPRTVV